MINHFLKPEVVGITDLEMFVMCTQAATAALRTPCNMRS